MDQDGELVPACLNHASTSRAAICDSQRTEERERPPAPFCPNESPEESARPGQGPEGERHPASRKLAFLNGSARSADGQAGRRASGPIGD